MAIDTRCPNPQCRQSLHVAENAIGRMTRCRHCDTQFVIRKEAEEVVSSSTSGSAVAATRVAPSHVASSAARRSFTSEENVPLYWEVGDVILDLYQVTDVLGEGGMGKVYKVRHRGWEMDLAVKSPLPRLLNNQNAVTSFERECETWVNLGLHAHVVSCYYVRRLGGTPRIFAEYVEGGDLRQWIKSGRLYQGSPEDSLRRIVDIAVQLAWGLHYAHGQGLVHQDVKPANVMMLADGTAKVTDFGLAKARAMAGERECWEDGQSILVSSGGMTPAYCSPEQANKQPLSRKTDLWSWALSVLEMFTGAVTWRSGTLALEALEEYLEDGSENDSAPQMPEPIVEILRDCFRNAPHQRPGNLREVASLLCQVHQDSTGHSLHRHETNAAELLADGFNNRAVSLLDLGQDFEAKTVLTQALEADPQHVQATYNNALLLWRSGSITGDEFLGRMRGNYRRHPGDWHSGFLYGSVLLELGDVSAATSVLSELSVPNRGRSIVDGAILQARKMIAEEWETRLGDESDESRAEAHITCLAISRNGQYALVGRGNSLERYDSSSGQCVHAYMDHHGSVESAAFSENGNRIISSADKSVYVWDSDSGRHVERFTWQRWTLRRFRRRVLSVGFLRDRPCALSIYGRKMWVWDLHTGQTIRSFRSDWRISAATMSANGQFVFVVSLYDYVLWNVEDGCSIWKHERESVHSTYETVTSIYLSHDAKSATVGFNFDRLRLWNLASSQLVRTISTDVGPAAVSNDGHCVVVGCRGNVARITGNGPQQHYSLCKPADANALVIAAKRVHGLRSKAEQLLTTDPQSAYDAIAEAMSVPGFAQNHELLLLRHRIGMHGSASRFVSSWSDRVHNQHSGRVTALTFSPDGRYLLSGGEDQKILALDIESARGNAISDEHAAPITSIAYAGNGQNWVSSSYDNVTCVRSAKTGYSLRTFPGRVCDINHDGSLVVTGTDDAVRLLDTMTGECRRILRGRLQDVQELLFSPDGGFVLIRATESAYPHGAGPWLWQVRDGSLSRVDWCLSGQEGSGAAITCDSAMMAFGLRDSVVTTTTTRHDERESLRDEYSHVLRGHSGSVKCIAFAENRRFLASGSVDYVDHSRASIRLFDIATNRCVHVFEPNHAGVRAVAFSKSDRFMASANDDGTVRLWQLVWDYDFS